MRMFAIVAVAFLGGFVLWSLARDDAAASSGQGQGALASACVYFNGQCVEGGLFQASYSLQLHR